MWYYVTAISFYNRLSSKFFGYSRYGHTGDKKWSKKWRKQMCSATVQRAMPIRCCASRSLKGFQSDQPWCDMCYELRIAEIRNDLEMYIIRWECLEITKLFYLHMGMWCHYTFRMFRNYKTLWMSLMLVRFILKIFIQYIQRLLWHHLTYLPTQIMN